MPIDRPDHVLIGPHRFSIRWDQNELLRMARAGAGDCFGQSEMAGMTIVISPDRSFTGMQETLLHEILHCLIWEAGISIPENPEADENDREEKLVGQFSGILLDCIKRNPQVFDWLDLKEERVDAETSG